MWHSFKRTENELTLEARAVFAGEDVSIVVTGGSKPHIGSISIAIPRPSIRPGGSLSATVSTINLPGHKDNQIGDFIAHSIAAGIGHTCVLSCGIHIDEIKEEDFKRVHRLSELLAKDILDALPATQTRCAKEI